MPCDEQWHPGGRRDEKGNQGTEKYQFSEVPYVATGACRLASPEQLEIEPDGQQKEGEAYGEHRHDEAKLSENKVQDERDRADKDDAQDQYGSGGSRGGIYLS